MTPPTPDQINDLAQQIHRENSAARNSQNNVPWSELGLSLKVSLLAMAEARLTTP